MTVSVEEDFRDFVVARWSELEPVARLVTLDPLTARRVTTDALADLHGQWGRLLDEGSPGAAARRAVLTGSLADAGQRRPGRSTPSTTLGSRAHPGATDLPDDAVVAALADAVRRAAPLGRAVLAAGDAWGLDPYAVADLAGMPPATVRDADLDVRRRLLEAHTAARAAAGWEPAEWAVDRDLADALDLLLADHADPPDAVTLVDERHRRVRRRSVVLGTGATLVAGAMTAWVVDAVASGTASEAAALPPRPGDPVWATTSTWPARGRLASDAGVAALVAAASPPAHLLWADDLAGQRVVVAAAADAGASGGSLVRMWTGPRGAAGSSLTPTSLVRDRVTFMTDVVPVAVDAGPDDEDGAGAVLLLARPTVLEATYSPVVAYASTGDVARGWTQLLLNDGIATVAFRGALPPAFRVRLDGYDDAPLGATPLGLPAPDRSAPLAQTLLEALGPFVAACTGLPVSAVQSTIALETAVPGEVLVPARPGEPVGRGRVVVAHTRLPSGALLRTVRVAGDGRGAVGAADLETTRVIDPGTTTDPVAARLPSFGNGTSRFLVVAPGAARAQLIATASYTYPASEVTALHGGTGVLEVADSRRAPLYRLVTWNAAGRRLGSWEQLFRRRDPRDLWPRPR